MILLAINRTNSYIAFNIDRVVRVPLMVDDKPIGVKEFYEGTLVDTETVPDTRYDNYRIQVDGAESDWLFTNPNVGGTSDVNNQEKTVTPTKAKQTVKPDKGYTGLNNVTVEAVTADADPNIKPENIVKGVDILGVMGTAEGGSGGVVPTVEDSTLVFGEGATVSGTTLEF